MSGPMVKARIGWWCAGAVTIAALLILAAPLHAREAPEPVTPLNGVPELAELKQFYEIPNFKIGGEYDLDDPASFEFGGEGGTTLESLGAGPLRTAYVAVGTPERNEAGEITNAVIINSYYSGDATAMYDFWFDGRPGNGLSQGAVVGPGKLIDTDKYYVVFLDALGLWGASKPSDGLGLKFPKYNYFDMVQANYRLLRDHLKVARVQLATGVSMGGTQTYVWGVMHPGYVRSIMPIGGSTATDAADPLVRWTFQLATAALKTDPVWQREIWEKGRTDYYDLPKEQHPNQGVNFSWSVLGLNGLDLNFRASQPWDKVKGEVFYWGDDAGPAGRAATYDAIDLLYRNLCGDTHNINDQLYRIQSNTLVVHITNDQWLNFQLAERSTGMINGAEIIGLESPLAHYAVFAAPNMIPSHNVVVQDFWRETGFIPKPEVKFTAENYRRPSVKMEGDPEKSFWKSQVTYPFPVKFANGKDSRGVSWEIGYMDEYNGDEDNPKTLLIMHGKGAFGAHYGYVIKYALERGLRVVVPDIPHYGMSGPGNLDKDMARTLQDAREAIYDVVHDQLDAKEVYCMGHSLGGQMCMGYALTYPDHVVGLILEGPAGLEWYPDSVDVGTGEPVPITDPSMGNNFDKWQKIWGQFGLVEAELARTPQEVEDFFYFRTRDPETGQTYPSKLGYFKRDTQYARLHTDQRIAMISGNRKEFEQWCTIFIVDVYSMLRENRIEDPDSLYYRVTDIKAPIFLAYGAREPFIPSTPFNGLDDLANDVIVPFISKMAAAGNKPVTKVYPHVAHFIHTDRPYEFSRDTVDFIQSGTVNQMSPEIIDALINVPTAAAGGAPAAKKSGGGFSK